MSGFPKSLALLTRILCTTTALALSQTALAQAADAPAEANEANPDQVEAAPGDIIVTATKRSSSINKVGLTIQAIGAEELLSKQITDVQDLTRVVPSLSFATTNANTPVYAIRGVGYYDDSLGATPSVAVYVDEVPYPVSVLTSQVVLDLERVEVLKGPQGTLFGESSTGGAINFIAAKPTDDFSFGGGVSYGRFNTIEGNGFVSGPITDTLSYRVAVKGEHGDDWQKSYTRDDTLGEKKLFAGRAMLKWNPGSGVNLLASVGGSINKSDPLAPQFIFFLPQAPGPLPTLSSIPYAPDNARAANWSPSRRPFGDDRQFDTSLRADVDVSDDITVTSITSFSKLTRDQQTDADGIVPLNFSSSQDGKVKALTQEIRASNSASSAFRWTVGANYVHTAVNEYSLVDTLDYSLYILTPGGLWENNGYGTDQKSNAYAAFANLELDIGDLFTIKGGVRYSHMRKVATSCTQDTDVQHKNAAFFTDLSNALRVPQGLDPIAPLPPFSCLSLDNISTDSQGRILYLPGAYTGELVENNVPWRVGVDFKPAANTLLYVNVAKGYKNGAFTTLAGATFTQLAPVTEESLLDIEGGIKTQLLDRRLNFTGAIFHYRYKDKQLRSKIQDPVFGLLDALKNVPRSHLTGAEASVTFTPIPELSFGGAITYLDSRIDEFTGYNGFSQTVDFEGTPIPFAPKYSATGNVDFTVPVNGSLDLVGGMNFTYNSATNSTVGTDFFTRIDDYTTVDARFGIKDSEAGWTVSLWGKNIFNEFYWTNANSVADTRVRYAAQPATYGISFSIRR